MIAATEGFVLREIRYGDTGSVVKIYTKDKGLRSFMVKGLRPSASSSSRNARKKNAPSALLPLLEVEFTYIEKRESQTLYSLQRFRPCSGGSRLYADVSKTCMLTFVAELLSKCLAEEQADQALYACLSRFVWRLEEAEKPYGHYHIWFLLLLTRYLGCYPQTVETGQGAVVSQTAAMREVEWTFDLQEGRFGCANGASIGGAGIPGASQPGAVGGTGVCTVGVGECGPGVKILHQLFSDFDQAEALLQNLSSAERQSVLHLLVRYYTIQFSLSELKSYTVLKEVFA